MKFDTNYHHRPPVHFANAGRGDASASSKPQGHRGPRTRSNDLPRPANAPTGVAQRDRTSPSAANKALSNALDYPERGLDRAAAVTLGIQRKKQQHELWSRSGFGFPQRCLDMARDNILAERNGHGRALVFLIPCGDAEANAGLLGHYLAKLGDGGHRRIAPALRDGIRACAELCAGYLVHTPWFEGAPVATYSHLANKLSKFPDRTACMEALAWIARQVMLAPYLHRLGDRQAAMLVGGLAKNARSDVCRDAILRVTGWLLDDDATRERLNAFQVPMLLNALSKWPAHEDAKFFVLQLADLMAPSSQLLYALDGQGVANSLNALSKWPGEARTEKPVLRMAKRLVAEPDLLLSMREQEVTSSLNALSKWAHREEATQAMLLLAARLADEPQLRWSVQPQGVATALNALSKLSEAPQAKQAVLLLADRIATEPRLLQALEAQGVANALGALSKWPGEARALRAAHLLTDRLATDPSLRRALKSQEFTGTLNALSKWPREVAMQHVALQLASRIPAEPELLPALGALNIANALNALCKWPCAEGAKRAALLLAARLEAEPLLCSQLGALELANSLGALAKWPDEAQMGRTAMQLAACLMAQPKLRQSMQAQGVANVLNALSKWPQQDTAKRVAMQLADRVATEPRLLKAMDCQHLANTLSALSRWPDEQQARHTAPVLAAHLMAEPDGRWRALDARYTSNVLFALRKWSDEHWATQLALQLAERIATEPTLLDDVDAQGVSDALSALSKWSGEDSARLATRELACRLIADTALQAAHGTQHLASTLNALAKWQREPEAMRAFWQLSTLLGRASHPWRKFNIADMAQIGNAFARLVQDEGEEFERARSVLQRLSIHLELHPECFECSNAGHIGVLFKSFASLRMQRELRPLGTPALNRVMALCRETQLRDEPLETVGNLCLGLLPLARSPELARHRVPALKTFESIQPIMARKIDSYLRQGVQATAGSALRAMDGQEACGTRGPALTFYQILKAYTLVARQWKPRYIQGDRQAVLGRQATLKQWVDRTLARTRGVIEADLQEKSWNLIAQIEAGDNVLNALDLRIGKELTAITQRHPPTRFNLAGTHARMRTEPGKVRPVKAGVGDTRHVTVDLQGRELRVDDGAEPPYSFYARLTGQPLVEVQLPGALSTFMLARTFQYQGEPWRFDLFGGSRLTRGHIRQVKSILANSQPVASVLPAMRYADSAPGSAFMALTHKLAPQREDWSRMQRALLEMVPRDHVVEGSLRIGWFEDVKVPGTPHPFRLKGPDGTRIALCPDDGCGFMKWEVALQIPAVREHIEAWQAVRAKHATPAQQELVAEHEQGANAMPPQALMHYPRDEAVLAEAHEAIQHKLDKLRAQVQGPVANAPNAQAPALSPDAVDLLALYQMTIGGGYEGRRIRAVPSADDKLYLPTIPMDGFAHPAGDLLVGKPPYDKENLLPIAAERVGTSAKGDATAHFLDQCFAIQYSYTGFDDDSGPAADMLHSKGMLIIPPPGYWSSAHDGMDLACSREDLKVLSRWKQGRDRAGLPDAMLSTGSLRVKDILMPGRLGALPIPELRKRNMDTDGDDAFVYAGYPKLAAHIRQVMEERSGRRTTEYAFKPPKTASPAFDEHGQYQAGRAREILAVQRGGQLVGSASNAATRFLSQPDELREAMARDMMFGTYDGVDRRLRNGLRARISGSADAPALRDLLVLAHEGIGRAHLPLAREVALLLHTLTTQLGAAGARPAPPVSAELAQRFGALAEAWAAATDTPARIHAILDHYPVCRLSHEQFPKGQPGYLEGEPELTIRNLFTLAVKVGTDALKSDTGTDLFSALIEQCGLVERRYPDRVRHVPHTKQTAREFRDGRFDPKRAVAALERIPTLAAGVMGDAVGALQQAGLLASPLAPAERARAASPGDIKRTAAALNEQAHAASARITSLLQANLRAWGGAGAVRLAGLEQAVKSTGSLEEKLGGLLGGKQLDLPEAISQVNDALRYSIVLSPPAFTSASRRIVAGLEEHGHVMTERTNHFNRLGSAFRALSVTLQDPSDGLLWEVQFHTEQTFTLKARYHNLYKQVQRARYQGASSDALRALLQPAWKDFNAVPTPAGCDEIEDWRQEPAQAAPGLQPGSDGQGAQRTIAAYLLPLARRLGAQARRIEALVSPKVQTALRTCGGKLREDQSGDWRNVIFKKERSIARKIALRQRAAQLAPEAAAAGVRDSLRYEVVLPAEGFGKTVNAILKLLGKQGLKVMRMKNPFAQPDTTYAGVNVNLRLASGNLPGDFEIQFHTAQSLSTKLRGHKDYEKLRELPPASTHDGQDEASAEFAAERERLLKKMRDAAALVERPQGIETLIPFDHYRDAPPSGTSRRTS
ncbi:XopAD/skwp family type III secretion system effector [Ralstonia solanacearum]|uniref:XopAD/skwp family type III secretion system effector n=1 Tax=Ralstonia solanacearum TaxID=305 RepID=UPI002304E45F|nr:XopAD/skwp family type III secretion system effector [Ralstonia solanacearum]MDB0567569.1 Type III effector protein (Skwp5) [Ralstonia solanacearum]MDB0577389.1 Type III effector protein (Skwp5) [Ralstonia solanacearum]